MGLAKVFYKEWITEFRGRVPASFSELNTDLYLDDHLEKAPRASSTHISLALAQYKVADGIDSIEVFYAGLLTPKLSILVNGEIIYADKLGWLDRLVVRLFPKNSSTLSLTNLSEPDRINSFIDRPFWPLEGAHGRHRGVHYLILRTHDKERWQKKPPPPRGRGKPHRSGE